MKKRRFVFVLQCLGLTLMASLHAQPYVFTTIAGLAGQNGFNDGIGAAARFKWPEYLATDNAGNVYVSDTANNAVRMLTHTAEGWNVRTIAGSPPFSTTEGILVDEQTNVFVADFSNGFIRKLTPSGTNWIVSTVSDAPGPWGLARDATGNLYYSDYVYDVIRRL